MKIDLGSGNQGTLYARILKDNIKKEEALDLLMEEASRNSTRLTKKKIQQLVEEREKIATTLVSENIAFPHAVKQGIRESVIILGVCAEPILWTQPNQFVQLIVLFAGGTKQHLQSMSVMAKLLRNPVILKDLLEAQKEEDLLSIIEDNLLSSQSSSEHESRHKGNRALLSAAQSLQKELKNSALAVMDDVFSSDQLAGKWYSLFNGYVLTSKGGDMSKTISIPNTEIVFAENELKRLTLEGHFKDLDSLIILHGEPASNAISSLRVVDLKNREEIRFIEDIPYNVSQRVLQIAREIGSEGREGKPVGCLFVIGTEEILDDYTHQLIVNPFNGYPEEERNIIDPSLEETIKEFSKIDGAFIIKPDGTIKSAGTYIAISPETLEHHPGEGARHASARGITAVTTCLAIAVSESTGRVSVYAKGRRIL